MLNSAGTVFECPSREYTPLRTATAGTRPYESRFPDNGAATLADIYVYTPIYRNNNDIFFYTYIVTIVRARESSQEAGERNLFAAMAACRIIFECSCTSVQCYHDE